MEGSGIDQLWALTPENVKNEGTSGDVYENIGDDDKMSRLASPFLQENAPTTTSSTGIRRLFSRTCTGFAIILPRVRATQCRLCHLPMLQSRSCQDVEGLVERKGGEANVACSRKMCTPIESWNGATNLNRFPAVASPHTPVPKTDSPRPIGFKQIARCQQDTEHVSRQPTCSLNRE